MLLGWHPMATALTSDWDVVLRDGSTLHLRPFDALDAPRVREFIASLSPETLRLRFFGLVSPEAFDMAGLDSSRPDRRFSILAEGRGRVLGLATYVRADETPAAAEAAFMVSDALQGRGLGTRLLELLAGVAKENGIETFTAHVLPHNRRMLDVFHESGFPADIRIGEGDLIASLDLRSAGGDQAPAFMRSQQAAAASMRRLFEPRRVAVVGVGRDGGIGAEIFRNLRGRFTGEVVAVNSKANGIAGGPYRSVRNIPGEVDLAIIAVPCAAVLGVIDECIEKAVAGLVVITAGFAETGAEGRAAQDRLLARVREAGIRLIGPNCMGILNTDPAVALNATFSPIYPPVGSVAMSTQSGALGLAILDYARDLNIGISSFASVGNKADVSSNDLIQYWAQDTRTRVILLYLESFGNPRTFSRLARHVGRAKPIVTIKAGRSNAGGRAASSHTGALATSDVVVDGLFQQAGVIRATTLEEMFDVAALLAHQPVPKGTRLGILTNAGGAAILAADAAESHGLTVPLLSQETASALRQFLPPAASVSNPVDMIASASADHYERSLRLLLADPAIDSVLVIYVPPLVTDPADVARAIVTAAAEAHDKPVAVTFMRAAGAPPELAPIPCYRFPEAATLAMARAAQYGEWRARPEGQLPEPQGVDLVRVRTVLHQALGRGSGWLTVAEAHEVLTACGVPLVAAAMVSTGEEAARVAGDLGFPVAVKAVGPTLLHKTEVGGVVLGLRDAAEVQMACRDLETRLGERLTGFLVQRMVPPGVEMLVGTVEEATFGPVMLCSLGGTTVELLGKPLARLLPLTDADIDDLFREMPGNALLRGYRGAPPVDEAALRDLLARVSQLAAACSEIQEMDINPVRLFEHGLSVVDARIRVARPQYGPSNRRISY
jgi:acetyl coenzyme A synthetase (ADP forming)-like protein